jgi:hypothetical protein
MPGSFDLSSSGSSLSAPAAPVFVYKYNADDDEQPFTWLPNVCCVSISERVGPSPPTAVLKYLFDDDYRINLGWPGRIEDVWPLDASGPYVVSADDRIVCAFSNPDGSTTFLFDGFAQIPQADITPTSERATFTAVGVAIREFDSPISGRVQRSGSPTGIQDTSGDSDVQIDLPCRFNPSDNTYGDDGGYQGNRTPDNFDTDDGEKPKHPVFTQVGIKGRDQEATGQYWSVSDAIKYLLAEYNPEGTYTQYPALSTLDDLLAVAYAADDGPITEGDILTDPLLIRDFEASNMPWPEAVAVLLSYAGFVMRWDLESGLSGMPQTYLRFYRTDMMSKTPTRWLYLDDPGNSLAEGSRNNVTQLHLARDSNAIVNGWQVETNQRQVEVTVYLQPLFQIAAGDAANPNHFTRAYLDENDADGLTRRKYRWYGADELGEGFWSPFSSSWETGTAFDFSPVFPADEDGTPSYVERYRPGRNTLASLDDQGKPLRARLDIGVGVGVDHPKLAQAGDFGSTTWVNVPSGWKLLPDRLGIYVDVQDPNSWATGNKTGLLKINAVEWWASPPSTINVDGTGVSTGGKPPILRLTVTIDDDLRMPISVGKRDASPTRFTRYRTADAHDHFQYTSIDPGSVNFGPQGGTGTDPLVMRDDTEPATRHAQALQRAHEMPPLAGSVTIPGIAFGYEVGDRVSYISGRGVQLYNSAGIAAGELPTFPTVVGRTFRLDGSYYTDLHITDFRAENRNTI